MVRPPRKYQVEWTEAASTDLSAVVDYIAREAIEPALRLLDCLEARGNSLEDHPRRGRIVPEMSSIGLEQFRELIEAPYRLVYEIDEVTRRVNVLGVFDGRRNFPELLRRRLRLVGIPK